MVEGGWTYNPGSKKVVIDLAQTQPGDAYRLPLEVGDRRAASSGSK